MDFQHSCLLKFPFITKFLYVCDISSMIFLNFFVPFSVADKPGLSAIKVNREKVSTSHPTTPVTPINKGIARGVTSVWRSHPMWHPRSHPGHIFSGQSECISGYARLYIGLYGVPTFTISPDSTNFFILRVAVLALSWA